MDLLSRHFFPPLMLSVPTGQITVYYVEPGVQWPPRQNVRPIRSASAGYFSLYGGYPHSETRVVMAVSFEEDDLPVLNRQVYYHYLDRIDAVKRSGGQFEFVFTNSPAGQGETEDYKDTSVVWRIHLSLDERKTLLLFLIRLLTMRLWMDLCPDAC